MGDKLDEVAMMAHYPVASTGSATEECFCLRSTISSMLNTAPEIVESVELFIPIATAHPPVAELVEATGEAPD